MADGEEHTMTNCLTHFHACACREQKIAELRQAAIDAAVELDHVKNNPYAVGELAKCTRIVERVFLTCEALDTEAIQA